MTSHNIIHSLVDLWVEINDDQKCFFWSVDDVVFAMKESFKWLLENTWYSLASEIEEQERLRKVFINSFSKQKWRKLWIEFSRNLQWVYMSNFSFENLNILIWKCLLSDFPSPYFNRTYGLWDSQGILWSQWDLIWMLQQLWFSVFTNERDFWRWQIEDNISLFSNLWLHLDNENVWYVGDYCWGVQKNEFQSFFDKTFTRRNGFGCERWYVRNLRDIVVILRFLGYRVADKVMQLERWRGMLIEKSEELAEVWIHYDPVKWLWYLDNIRDVKAYKRLKINNKKMGSFPHQIFNRKHGIWDTELRNMSKGWYN